MKAVREVFNFVNDVDDEKYSNEKTIAFWEGVPCTLLEVYRHVGDASCLHSQGSDGGSKRTQFFYEIQNVISFLLRPNYERNKVLTIHTELENF
jgi:hypothetical protein